MKNVILQFYVLIIFHFFLPEMILDINKRVDRTTSVERRPSSVANAYEEPRGS